MSKEKLIELVRMHRELYDTKHNNYMKASLKNLIWSKIATTVDYRDGEEAKHEWLKLRGSYRDARRRYLKSLNSSGTRESFRPWRFYEQMSFLNPYMLNGMREGNYNSDDDSKHPIEQAIIGNFKRGDEYEPTTTASTTVMHKEIKTEYDLDEPYIISEQRVENTESDDDLQQPLTTPKISKNFKSEVFCEFPNAVSTPVMRKRIKPEYDFEQQQLEESPRQWADNKNLLEQNRALNDPLYTFFISMYQQTRSMPSNYQHMVKAQVFQAVSEAEAAMMNTALRQQTTTFNSSCNGDPLSIYTDFKN